MDRIVVKHIIVTYTSFSKTPVSVPCVVREPELLTVSRRPGARVMVEVVVNDHEVIQVDARDVFRVDESIQSEIQNLQRVIHESLTRNEEQLTQFVDPMDEHMYHTCTKCSDTTMPGATTCEKHYE